MTSNSTRLEVVTYYLSREANSPHSGATESLRFSLKDIMAVISSRPVYSKCGARGCGRDVLYKDYMDVLVQAGVEEGRLVRDLLIDPDTCCTRELIANLPRSEDEFEERLRSLKEIQLISPPEFYVVRPREEIRPMYVSRGGVRTNYFLGAEPYYYLVERGENPTTILSNMQITNPIDIQAILDVTDRPANEFECVACGEYIPHYKFASQVYKSRSPAADLLSSPDRLKRCCQESVIGVRLTKREEEEMKLEIERVRSQSVGLPLENRSLATCMSCGDPSPSLYHNYSWLIHHGVPSVVALNYFGLTRLCCRQSIMNPTRVVLPSKSVQDRAARQIAAIPQEEELDYDYASSYLPPLSGSL